MFGIYYILFLFIQHWSKGFFFCESTKEREGFTTFHVLFSMILDRESFELRVGRKTWRASFRSRSRIFPSTIFLKWINKYNFVFIDEYLTVKKKWRRKLVLRRNVYLIKKNFILFVNKWIIVRNNFCFQMRFSVLNV